MKWINISKYISIEHYRGVLFNCTKKIITTFWKVYQFYLKVFYSPQFLVYRADIAWVGIVFLATGFFSVAAAIANDVYFCYDHTSVSSETTVIPPQVDVSPKVPAPKPMVLEGSNPEAPTDVKVPSNVTVNLFLAGTGLIIVGSFLVLLGIPLDDTARRLLEDARKLPTPF